MYAPNFYGGPKDLEPEVIAGWQVDGTMVRAATDLHADDDDWGQAGTMVREVLDDAARQRLVDNIVGHLLNDVSGPVLRPSALRVTRSCTGAGGRPDRYL